MMDDDFTQRVDRLTERLRRHTLKYDQIEERADLIEERFSTLQQSVKTLARLLEVSLLLMVSSEKELVAWKEWIRTDRHSISNPIRNQFLSRLETSLRRSIDDADEKHAYIEALSLVHQPSIVSSRVFFK